MLQLGVLRYQQVVGVLLLLNLGLKVLDALDGGVHSLMVWHVCHAHGIIVL